MSEYQLFEYVTGEKRKLALMENTRLLEYHEETFSEQDSLVDRIYLGRVERVLKDLGAAFIEIGQKKKGFLPICETDSFQKQNPKALMSGDEIIVQVKKDPKGEKGAFLSRDISLAGQYLLLMPMNRFTGVSKRVTEDFDRDNLRIVGEKVAGNRFGVIMRSAALGVEETEISREAEELYEGWNQLKQSLSARRAPALLSESKSLKKCILQDYSGRHTLAFTTNDAAEDIHCSDTEMEAIWRSKRIAEQLKAALSRKCDLPGGAQLVIDECEALTAIDVNSGRQVFSKDQSLALRENLAAVDEIARQIRLRDLSGIIIVDYINVETDSERGEVLHAMEKALADDRIKTVVHGFTSLGLCEITRKRTENTLRQRMEYMGVNKNAL